MNRTMVLWKSGTCWGYYRQRQETDRNSELLIIKRSRTEHKRIGVGKAESGR